MQSNCPHARLFNSGKMICYSLSKPESVAAMVSYVVDSVPPDSDELTRYRFPFLSAEILSADISSISSTFFSVPQCADRFFAFLDQPSPLSALQAEYFAKVLSVMAAKHAQEVMAIADRKRAILRIVSEHMGCFPFVDLLFRLFAAFEAITSRHFLGQVRALRALFQRSPHPVASIRSGFSSTGLFPSCSPSSLLSILLRSGARPPSGVDGSHLERNVQKGGVERESNLVRVCAKIVRAFLTVCSLACTSAVLCDSRRHNACERGSGYWF